MIATGNPLTALFAAVALAALATGASAQPEPARRGHIERMVLQDCGSCHGMSLKGGLGPALTAEALQGKPGEMLAATILHGRPGTPMPPWKPFMSAQEARWIVEQLQKGAIRAQQPIRAQ